MTGRRDNKDGRRDNARPYRPPPTISVMARNGQVARGRYVAVHAIALFVSAIALAGSCLAADAVDQTAAAVVVRKVTGKCFSSIVFTTGYIVPRSTAVVMFNVSGYHLTKVSVKEGDTVKAGDVVAEAQADTAGPGDQKPTGTLPDLQIQTLAGGFVLKRNAEAGMPMSAKSEPLFTIAVDGDLEAAVDVPSIHVLELAKRQMAHISMDDGRDLPGRVRLVPVEIDQKTQVGQARVAITGHESAMAGRFVHVAIDSSRSCGIAVPRAALTHGSDAIRVQVVKNGVVETRQVEIGILDEADAYIASGLAPGDIIVADAGTSLRDGDRVRPIMAENKEPR